MISCVLYWPTALLLGYCIGCTKGDKYEFDLYAKLLTEYTTLERPVANHSEAVYVNMSFILQQIVGVDEKNQVQSVSMTTDRTYCR